MERQLKTYRFPAEWEQHEGTWLQWPHDRHYRGNQLKVERTWLMMVDALHQHEKVHLIVEDEVHRDHVVDQLRYFGIGLDNVDIFLIPTDGNWARDNGPIFLIDGDGKLVISNWIFNGWANRFEFELDNQVPIRLGDELSLPVLNPPLVIEGGAVEVNGQGTFMGTRSSIMHPNRNPEKSQEEIEQILTEFLGVTHFIWLRGAMGEEAQKFGNITDAHIDGSARFVNERTILYNWTEDDTDPRYNFVNRHLNELKSATTQAGISPDLVPIPLPKGGVYRTSFFDSKRSRTPRPTTAIYANFYIANEVVLVPVYGNVEDERAKAIISEHFPNRDVIGIETLGLIEDGGSIHCVTQQQPYVSTRLSNGSETR
jgi:agmatine deiminase